MEWWCRYWKEKEKEERKKKEQQTINQQRRAQCIVLSVEYEKQMMEWSKTAGNKKMELLYKATRDGFSGQDFRNKCDSQGETWTIVEDVKGNVFGGYTSVSWKGGNGHVGDSSAYLFTLVNPHGIPPTQYKQKDQSHSLYDVKDYPPIFGGGHDLFIRPNSNQNNQSETNFPYSYEGKGNTTFTGAYNFQSKEIEVWGSMDTGWKKIKIKRK